jgi:hypothetical protein
LQKPRILGCYGPLCSQYVLAGCLYSVYSSISPPVGLLQIQVNDLVLTRPRLIAPIVRRSLTRDRDTVAKHAVPIIKERMKIIEDADAKGVEPNLPVSISFHSFFFECKI